MKRFTMPTKTLLCALLAATCAPAQGRGEATREIADLWLRWQIPAEDAPDAACLELLAGAARFADSPVAELLVERAATELSNLTDPERGVEALRAILDADCHGLVEQRAREALASLLDELGRRDEADRIEAFEGYARRFVVVGPFGDAGDWFNGAVFPPELVFPDVGDTLAGRTGPVRARTVTRDPWKADVDLSGERFGPGCWYALHQVRVPDATACWLELRTDGSFEVFVNGARVARLDRITERVPARRTIPVVLSPGVNHVLVKTTHEDDDVIAMRYVDAVGRDVSGLEELPAERVEPVATGRDGARPPLPPAFTDGLDALHRAATRGEDAPADELLEITSALADVAGGHADRGLTTLWRLRAARPSDPRLMLALAECFRRAGDLPNEIGAAESRRLVEAAAEALPDDHHEAAIQVAALLRADDRLEDAVRLLEERVAAGDAGPRTFSQLDSLLGALRHESRREQVRALWRQHRPHDERPLMLALSDTVEAGRADEALAAIEGVLRVRPGDESLLRVGIQIASSLGARDRAIAMFDTLHARDAGSAAALRARAEMLATAGASDAAGEAWQRAAEHPELDADGLFDIGWGLWRAGRTDEACAAFERCLELEPERHAVRQMLLRVAGEPDFPFLERFRLPRSDVDELVANFEVTDRESGAPSTLLVDRMTVVFYPDGSHVEETHQVRRLNDLAGVEAHEQAEAAARANELVRLRTIDAEGRSYVPKRVGGTFSMPRLAPGAFVEELYRNYGPAALAEPWRGPEFWFQGQVEPFLWSEFVVVLPPNAPGSMRSRNLEQEPDVVELDDGWRALRFTRRDTPRLPKEQQMPDAARIVPIVTYGEDREHGEVARRSAVFGRYRARVTAPIAEATAQVLAEVEEGDTARLRALHAFVNAHVAGGRGPSDATAALLTRRGPRFFLLSSMLAAAGVPHRHAVVADTREDLREAPEPLFLGDDEFDVPALLVEPADGPTVWLFADDPRHAPLGFVPASRDGAAALLVDGDEFELVRVRAARASLPGWEVRGGLDLDTAGDVRLEARLELGDAGGYDVAERIREMDANRRSLVGRSLATQLFPGWTVDEARIPALPEGEPFAATIVATRRGLAQRVDGRLALPLPLPESDMFRRYGAPSPRTMPLDVRGQTAEDWELLVRLTGGLELASMPDEVRVRHALCDYVLTFERVPEGLKVRRTVRIRPGRIEPGSFAAWVRMLQSIDRAEQARIELVQRGG